MTFAEAKKIKLGERLFVKWPSDLEFVVVDKEVTDKDVFFISDKGEKIHHRQVGGFAPVDISASIRTAEDLRRMIADGI